MTFPCVILLLVVFGGASAVVTWVRLPRWRWRILVAIGLLAIGAGILFHLRSRFDSDAWKTASVESNRRWAMYKDLVHSHELKGMARADLIALLGQPDEARRGPFERDSLPGLPDYDDYQPDEEVIYFLGYASSIFPIDVDIMFLYLKDERVDRYGWRST